MATKQRNILKEAIEDSKTLRAAALSNAKVVLMDSIKGSLTEAVNRQLEEAADEDHVEPDGDECSPDDVGNVTEGLDLGGEGDLDLDLDEEGDEDEDGDDDVEGEESDMIDDEDMDGGLTESDLSEAIAEALETIDEVQNPSMGDSEMVSHDDPADSAKETPWEDEVAPAAKDHTVKESQKTLRKKVTELVKENVLLKKANKKLRETVDEIKLFNTKIMYANKLIAKEGLSADTKRKIVEKMDKAATVVEARSIYEAFDCALGTLSESAKPKGKKAPALSEVLGSTGKPMSRETLRESVNGDSFGKERFQRLAGITRED